MANLENKKVAEMAELSLSRANTLIQSKHNCSLTENKLIALGLATVKMDNLGIPYSDIPVAVLKQYEGIEQTNIYKKVKEIAQFITTHTVICEENIQGKLRFEVFTLVNNAEYIDGAATFRLTFNPSIVPMISNIKAPYTTLRLKTLMSFKNNYAYRLYEILATKEYLLYPKQKAQALERVTLIYNNINELRMQLTLVQIDDDKLKVLLSKPYEDLTVEEKMKMEKVLEKSHYRDWRDFRKSVIEVAKEHMENNPLCPITFDYEPIRSGRGGKVVGIHFYIYKNEKYVLANEHILEDIKSSNSSLLDKLQQVRTFMGVESISDYSIVSLLEIAEYDVSKIKAAYNLAKQQEYIENLVGWMTKAIKENWGQENISLLKNRSEEETEQLKEIYESYSESVIDVPFNEIDCADTEVEQYTFDFENEQIVPEKESEKTSSLNINPRFVELATKSYNHTLTAEESIEMQELLMEFTQSKIKHNIES